LTTENIYDIIALINKSEEACMIEINSWMDNFLGVLKDSFGKRIWFVGLQGSYGRNEATEKSDIDVVVILDNLSCEDIKKYNLMLDTLPHRELICGFVSGKNELLNWEPSDLFQFYYDTKPIIGSLDELLPLIDNDAVDKAIKMGACNIYHGCVHNMLHEKNDEILKGL
jgi:predicted nucleotidyltransferase